MTGPGILSVLALPFLMSSFAEVRKKGPKVMATWQMRSACRVATLEPGPYGQERSIVLGMCQPI